MAALSERQAKAAEAAAKAAAAQSRGSGYSHVVEAGQTLSAIGEAYGVSVRAIMRANKISDPTKLQVGQKLFIPDP
ncbi:MAG TPA: LysM peptidoglycan-binding domain-containing protein [Candidatus Spyradenecus faecavium]|uniref:LysM peptidoglycan-binding domain-containing protein n=1 Tax=Candidatus Spyradenecus faecavium TaxID=2840947 RepID=A0A9D1NPX0_9BACT|nr:LysM peptidoglycan-binding domain-containing protein [Candidatus Spyradenecus faecavium]